MDRRLLAGRRRGSQPHAIALRRQCGKGALPASPRRPTPVTMILPLAEASPHEIERLLDAAFGADRRARTAYRLREGVAPIAALSFAAFDDARALVGSLQSWPVALTPPDGAPVRLVLVGPVAVRPDRQRGGLGRALMEHALARADAAGADPQVLIGDPEYYGRFFGFTAESTGAWDLPGPFERRRLLARTGGRSLDRKSVV